MFPPSYWSLEICTEVAGRPPHSSRNYDFNYYYSYRNSLLHSTSQNACYRQKPFCQAALHCLWVPSSHLFCIIKNSTYSEVQHFIQKFLVMDAWGRQLCSKPLILVGCCFKPQSTWSCNWFLFGSFPLQIKARNTSLTPSLILQSLNLFHRPMVIPLQQGFPFFILQYTSLLNGSSHNWNQNFSRR